jgi:Na+-transporting NADH:ubiquinone oxidoreductase subunit C
MAAHERSPLYTLVVALAVCLVCSLVVSSAAVLLAPRQRANREQERRARVLELIARQPGLGAALGELGSADVREVVIDLASGTVADWVAPDSESRPDAGTPMPPARDLALIGRRPALGTAYVVIDQGRTGLVLLPVYGAGYASVLRGYVALGPDLNTVRGLTFHEHAETPGVGGEVLEDEEWLDAWIGRRVRDDAGRVRIGTSLQELDPDHPDARHLVDAISGATRTTVGVGNLLRFWLGEDGYGPFLRRLAEEGPPR